MQIHLYISEFAPAGNRLKTALKDTMSGYPIIQYDSMGAIGRLLPVSHDDQAVAVVMVGKLEELALLAEIKNFWDRVKTILILPNSNPETISMGHALRPRYLSFMDNAFYDVIAVLDHIGNGHKNETENLQSHLESTKKEI